MYKVHFRATSTRDRPLNRK